MSQIKTNIKDIDDVRPPDTPPGALLPPLFEPQPLISGLEELKTIDRIAGPMNIYADATKIAAENTGELFGTIIKGGANVSAIIKRFVGQLLRMTVLQNVPFLGGFMRVFGMQRGGMIRGMPMMNMRPDLAIANENPQRPELVAPLDAEKLRGLFQVNVNSADPGTTVSIVLKGLKGVTGQALADSLTRDVILPAIQRDEYR